MNCCGKTMDGLDDGGNSQGGTIDGDVIITGDLSVEGGEFNLGVGPDGWSNIRSSDLAFGLDLEAPLTKKIRLINDTTPIVEIDTNLNLIGSSGSVGLLPSTTTTTFDFIFPNDAGSSGLVLTSQGPGLETYWSAGGGGGGGTVTSVAMTVPSFLSVSGSPITTNGTLTVTLSGTPLPIANGGTSSTTATGSGAVVLQTSPSLTTPNIGVATGLILNLNGTTSGTVSIRVQPVAGTFNFNLPTTAGSPGQFLTSQGGGVSEMTWTTPPAPGTGTVTSVGITPPSFLNASAPITTSGNITLSYNGTPLPVLNGGTGTTTSTGTGSVVLSASPTLTGTLTCGRITASANIAASAVVFGYIFQNTNNAVGTYIDGFHHPNVPVGNDMYMGTGIGLTIANPSTLVGFHYRTGSTSFASLSVYGCTVPLVTDVTGQVRVQANITSTSTITGSITTPGGLGVGGNAFIGQSVNVNYGGTTTSPQLRISPATNNTTSTIAFYTNTSNGGDSWVAGHSGTGNFSLTSSATAQTKIAITPSGPVSLPSGASSLTFIDITGSATGTISIRAQANAGTYNFNLPIAVGLPGQVLTSQGGAASEMTWTTLTTGTVTSVGIVPPSFLNASSPITTSGNITLSYNGTPLPVLNGGTGVTTSTGSVSNVLSTSPTITTPILINPSANSLGLTGSTSGIVSILPPPLFASYNFNLPTTAGTSGQVLTSGGGSTNPMTWQTLAGTGTVTSVGLAVPTFLNVSGSPIVSSGTITIGLSGSPLPVLNGGTGTTTSTGTGSVVLSTSPTLTGTLTCGRILASDVINPSPVVHGYLFNNTNNAAGLYINGFNFPNVPVGTDVYTGTGIGLSGPLPATLVGFHYRSPIATSFASLSVYGCTVPLVTDVTGQVRVQANIASTTTTTGSITTPGGIGIGGNANIGGTLTSPNILGTGQISAQGQLNTTSTTASTNTTTGSIVAGGGIGVAGAINAGGAMTTTRIATSTTAAPGFISGINTFTTNNNTNGFNTSFENPSIGAGTSTGIFIGRTPATEGIGFTFQKGATAAQNAGRIFHANVGESAAFFPPGTASTSTTTGTVTVNGGLGVNGAVYASSFNLSTTPTTYAPTLTCATHTVTVNSGSSYYLKMGPSVVYSFNINYDITSGSNNDLIMSLPFQAYPLTYTACLLDKSSDLTQGTADGQGKTYGFQLFHTVSPIVTGTFFRFYTDTNTNFQYGGVAFSNCVIRGTITYLTA